MIQYAIGLGLCLSALIECGSSADLVSTEQNGLPKDQKL